MYYVQRVIINKSVQKIQYISHGKIRWTGGLNGQKLIRSDKSHLYSGPKDQQWPANVFVDTTAQAVLILESEVSNTIRLMQVYKSQQDPANYMNLGDL